MKKRLLYAAIAIILTVLEVLIALFVNDSFIRPYLGDMIVVIVVYAFVRIFIPEKFKLMPLYVFIFSVIVEVLQFFHIVDLLGLGGNVFFRVLIGGTFDFKDIACYAFGCLILFIHELSMRQTEKRRLNYGE